jgi:hypothetical protein
MLQCWCVRAARAGCRFGGQCGRWTRAHAGAARAAACAHDGVVVGAAFGPGATKGRRTRPCSVRSCRCHRPNTHACAVHTCSWQGMQLQARCARSDGAVARGARPHAARAVGHRPAPTNRYACSGAPQPSPPQSSCSAAHWRLICKLATHSRSPATLQAPGSERESGCTCTVSQSSFLGAGSAGCASPAAAIAPLLHQAPSHAPGMASASL